MLTQYYVALLTRLDSTKERGAGMAEYALILALVAVLLVASFTALKNEISTVLSKAVSAMS